ncbi:MAG: 5'/3'-nucleotidase SurE [Candidatus Dadabacteria bacterium]|nr:5'/3'-nucleotidase SurE [Candidatus Dadabacteria bacterium]NIQ13901.1 5'/3'-nucleotidase SurE [Candidatus Dadabacteria bacterium]
MKKRILISNDDGISSEGLSALAESLKSLGEVIIVAPDRDQSAASHSLSLFRPLRIENHGYNKYSVDGTPTDCINLAVNGFLKNNKPDLIVSGINMSANLGDDITYSGTVSAAIEGTLLKIPSIAVSLDSRNNYLFDTAAHYSNLIGKFVLENGLAEDILLNVNIPNLPIADIKGIKVTRQGKRIYEEPIVEKLDPRGREYYWIGGNELGHVDIRNSDIVCVKSGYVSVTPIKLDLTDYDYIDQLKTELTNYV